MTGVPTEVKKVSKWSSRGALVGKRRKRKRWGKEKEQEKAASQSCEEKSPGGVT